MKSLLTAKELTRKYGNTLALDNFSINLARGDVVGLVGPNGAGKTTALRMLGGSIKIGLNKVFISGQDIVKNPSKAFSHLGILPEGAPLWVDAFGIDILRFIAFSHFIVSKKDFVASLHRVDKIANIKPLLHKRVDQLSKGMKRRLALAAALIHDPDLLILDEPSDGLDPRQRKMLHKSILSLKKDHGILISTHDLQEVKEICNKVIILHKGKIVAEGDTNAIAKSSKIKSKTFEDAYMKLTEVN